MRTKLRSKVTFLFMTFALMLAMPAMALADITLDTSATLATDANLPTSVEVGENSFTIKVWRAGGNVGASKTGEFSIVKEYNMDANGTITPANSTDSTKIQSFDWSDLACSGSNPAVGCSSTNPATITAKLIVAAGAQGKTGQLQISQIAAASDTSGIVTDPSPASGFVRVAGKAAGSVTINNIPANAVFGGSFTPSYTKLGDGTPSTTSNTPSICSVSGGDVSFDAVGTCKLQASVAEGTNHLQANGSEQTFEIAKAQAQLSFAAGTLSKIYNGNPQVVTVNTSPSGLNDVEIKYDGLTTAPTNAGSYEVVATLDNPNYQADQISDTLVIDKAPTTTTVTCTGAPFTYTGDPITPCSVSVTGAGGLNLTPTPDYSNNVNAGTATASYTYAESANHLASDDSENFTIDQAQAQVALGNLGPHIWDGSTKTASVTTTPSGLNVDVTYNGSTTAPSAVGSYSVVATVDEQNYEGQTTGTLVISAWTLNRFFAPVDYDTTTLKVWNTVKGGATVPLKFEIFKGTTESSNTADVDKFIFTGVVCPGASAATDDIEITTTGGTQLRYDTTAGQFIQNWQTPKKPGACYDVTMQTDDGSKLPVAHFMLK